MPRLHRYTIAYSVILVSLFLILQSVSVRLSVANQTVTVEIIGKRAGHSSSIGWVGSVDIEIDGVPYVEYCTEHDEHISVGSTYTATVNTASDTQEWRSVSYILAWYALRPGSVELIPVDDDDEAYAVQVAIWRFTSGLWVPANPPVPRAEEIHDDALEKNVARPGDSLTLTAGSNNVPPGMPVTVTAQLTPAREDVKILFSTDKGVFQDTGTKETEKETDSGGQAEAVVICPSESGQVKVTAETRACWVTILDLGDNQDLVPMGYPIKAEVLIDTITIFVVSEVGTLAVLITGMGALAARRLKKLLRPDSS